MPGEPNVKFAVSSSDEVVNYLINPKSEFWVSKSKLIYSVEKTKISINFRLNLIFLRSEMYLLNIFLWTLLLAP